MAGFAWVKSAGVWAYTCVISLLTIGALLAVPASASATTLPSAIEEDTTLTVAESPFTGGTTVASGVTLTIDPGVEITNSEFTVKGTLLAEGTAEEPILLEGNSHTAVSFEPGSGASVLDHVQVVKAGGAFCCPNLFPRSRSRAPLRR